MWCVGDGPRAVPFDGVAGDDTASPLRWRGGGPTVMWCVGGGPRAVPFYMDRMGVHLVKDYTKLSDFGPMEGGRRWWATTRHRPYGVRRFYPPDGLLPTTKRQSEKP